ncbi:MAG: peptidylprolyl isomerase [Actinomycetota bacterium]
MRRTTFLLAAVIALLPACGDLFAPAAAVVAGSKITISEIDGQVDQLEESEGFKEQASQGDASLLRRTLEQQYLTILIRREVLQPAGARLDVEVTEDEVTTYIEEVVKPDFPSEEEFTTALSRQGITLSQLEDLVYDQLLEDELQQKVIAEVEPPEEELRDYYESHIDDFTEIHAQHILVSEKGLAQEVHDRLVAAPRREVDDLFARIARNTSEDTTTKKDAGDLGFTNTNDFVPPFSRAVKGLEDGEISEPVKTRFGYHVIRRLGTRARPFEDVRFQVLEEIAGEAQDEAWKRWLRERYESADIEVNPRYGVFDIASQQVVDTPADQVPGTDAPAQPQPGAEVGN